MIRMLFIYASLAIAAPSLAAAPDQHEGHGDGHDHAERQQHDGHAHGASADGAHASHEKKTEKTAVPGLTATPEIVAALENGGEGAVVEVLGVVCDFCATAMNKTFGKRAEVAAVYVDLDVKTLNLVFENGASLDDETIAGLVEKAGYRIAAIHRGATLVEGSKDATDPS